MANRCQNSSFVNLTNTLNGTHSAQVNTDLNSQWTTWLKDLQSLASSKKKFKGLECDDEDNANAADCDFICQNVLTSTGFREDAFHTLDTSSTTRRRILQTATSGGLQFVDSGASLDLDGISVPDSQLAVAEQTTVTTGPSHSVVLAASLTGAILALFLAGL